MNPMKRFDPRVIVGVLLLAGGGLLLLQNFGYLQNVSGMFWGVVFLLAGLAFLAFVPGGAWWGVFPGMTLLGLGVIILFGNQLGAFAGAVFLGAIALAFWLVYLINRSNWWAIIPAGVMTTLAAVSVLPEIGTFATGGVFFIGLALTFALLGLVANLRWAYYPAAALGALGILSTASLMTYANYIWAILLIVIGGFLIFRFFNANRE